MNCITKSLLMVAFWSLTLTSGREAMAQGYGGYPGGRPGGRVIDVGRPGGRVLIDPGRPGGRLIPGYDPGAPGGRVLVDPPGGYPGYRPGYPGYRPGYPGYRPGYPGGQGYYQPPYQTTTVVQAPVQHYQIPAEYAGTAPGYIINYGGVNYITDSGGTMSPYAGPVGQ